MAMAGADPFAIMKALGHSDLQMTMHYVSLGKSHIREQVEKLNTIRIPTPPTTKRKSQVADRTTSPALRIVSTR
jgi:hypothetical protein